MTGAFLFLASRSLRNRVARRFRRLRQPRYVAGLLVGLLYLYFAFLRNQIQAVRKEGGAFASPELTAMLPAIVVVGGIALWVFSLVAWFWPSGAPPLRFSGAEVQFLFPAPVSRRQILNYKLLRSQVGVVIGVLIAGIFSGAATAAAAGRWTFLVGGLITFSTIRLHLLGISLTRGTFEASAGRMRLRAWLPPGLMAVASTLIIVPIALHAGELWDLGLARGFQRLLELARSQPAASGLWPFTAAVAPVVSLSGRVFLATAIPAVGLLALNYWWVLQSDAALEQAASFAEKQQAKGTRVLPVPVARRAPFRLRPEGRPELALLWKNLILLGRYASLRMVLRLMLPVVIISVAFGMSGGGRVVAPLALIFAAFFTLLGPYMMRNDLRHDMPRLTILKTWPIRGTGLLVGELLAPAVVLTLLAWTGLAVALALSGGLRWAWATRWDLAALALTVALAVPALVVGQLLIQNAAVILFPGWVPTGSARARGIEAMGQQMLMLAGTLLALILGVLPAAAVAGLAAFVFYGLIGVPGFIPAGLLLAGILFLETAIVVAGLGRVLDRTEPAQVEAEE